MKKYLLISCLLFAFLSSEEDSKLNEFEKTIQNKPVNSTENEKKDKQDCAKCTQKNNSSKKKSTLEDHLKGISTFLRVAHIVNKVIFFPIWVPKTIDEYIACDKENNFFIYNRGCSHIPFYYDEYPFKNSNTIYLSDNIGKKFILNTEYSHFDLKDNIYGDKLSIDYQFYQRWGINYSDISLEEKINNLIIQKDINILMLSYIWSISESTFVFPIDVSLGIGKLKWDSEIYSTNGTRIQYKVKTYLKPISFMFDYGISYLSNSNLYDTNFSLKYHFKKINLNFGYQRYTVKNQVIEGKVFSIGYWF